MNLLKRLLRELLVHFILPGGLLFLYSQSFRAEPQLAFRQVYVSPERRGASAGKGAEKLLVQLRARGMDAATTRLGDASMLPSEQPLVPLREVGRAFGDDFAAEALLRVRKAGRDVEG